NWLITLATIKAHFVQTRTAPFFSRAEKTLDNTPTAAFRSNICHTIPFHASHSSLKLPLPPQHARTTGHTFQHGFASCRRNPYAQRNTSPAGSAPVDS